MECLNKLSAASPVQWVLLFLGLMVVQDTITLFINHRLFATSELCTNIDQRLAGGRFAEEHCYEHEQYAYNGFSIRHWIYMFAEANYKILGAYALAGMCAKLAVTPVVGALASSSKFIG